MAEFAIISFAARHRHARRAAHNRPSNAPLLQGVDDFLRHVRLVVLGQHGIGFERAAAVERAFGDDALPFAEQVGQDALIADRELARCRRSPRSARADCRRARAAFLDQPAEPDAGAGLDVLFHHVGRRIEEHDGILQRAQHQRRPPPPARRARRRSERGVAACESFIVGSLHDAASAFQSQSFDQLVDPAKLVGIAPPSARRASAAAAWALSRSPSTI